MKKLTLIFVCSIAFACNNESTSSTKETVSADTTAGAVSYPYTINHPDYWDIGSSTNTLAVLSSLKAWEQGNIDESVKYFADTVLLEFDGPEMILPKDSLKAMFTADRGSRKDLSIDMKDWESVISKDKQEEWVTIWYTQHEQSKDGKMDSVAVINDVQMKNGKIMRLAEYTRKLH